MVSCKNGGQLRIEYQGLSIMGTREVMSKGKISFKKNAEIGVVFSIRIQATTRAVRRIKRRQRTGDSTQN